MSHGLRLVTVEEIAALRRIEEAADALRTTVEWMWDRVPVEVRERCTALRAALSAPREDDGEREGK
jgi:hypothetical protein